MKKSDYPNYIRTYYRDLPDDHKSILIDQSVNACSFNSGIGDSLMAYQCLSAEATNGHTFFVANRSCAEEFVKFNTYISQSTIDRQKPLLNICDIQTQERIGGHFLQKIQTALGLKIQDIPRPILHTDIPTKSHRVVMTFDRGAHGANQTHLHPRPRILYPEHQECIQKFINQNQHKYEFIEVGRTKSALTGVQDQTNIGITKTTELIASCDFFFGIHNGLMHIAAGLQKKSIIIINFPKVEHVVLPAIKYNPYPDVDWLYPQNVHLHQDNASVLVPKLCYNTIMSAFNGEVYPFYAGHTTHK